MIDKFLFKKYDYENYNCAHFVVELWAYITNKSIYENLKSFLTVNKSAKISIRSKFELIKTPVSPCIVLFKRRCLETHVGIFYKNKVFHLNELGAMYQPLDIVRIGFSSVRFYNVK